jgi:hypothetical protein
MMKLTEGSKTLLRQVSSGADVYGFRSAVFFRRAEKAGLVKICNAQADIPGEQQQPYFGCILTAKGKAAIGRG